MFLETENGILLRPSETGWAEDRIVDFKRNKIEQLSALHIYTEEDIRPSYTTQELSFDARQEAVPDSLVLLQLIVALSGVSAIRPLRLTAQFYVDRSISLAAHQHPVSKIGLVESSKYITAVKYGDVWRGTTSAT